ncbi:MULTISPECIES: ABC transporter ATP-binding protein [Bosea]|uniref:ABC transporter ATP-binding protein n=1 Tax=Bosea TaxID=85413 RepID=UPI00214F8892|nr:MULTISPECIES: sn-glycerol-3-phosphate ABC transporter ATP-binding protein UgpC [Bosea]MCR4522631.1 sn-glycerol-3-phosphate ABC transporter ATP-binding protein UgpC [Bosea sp. 47.2.35]MDR6827139.1 ABC-type sugar transport system ATPase subunit [Bosea robiniae]MDR6893849.1 ABC-type sugar transport system ATPase subunit [Bosea sp. BE109]MDR7136451.1 ABC-type sugar transport system ATPase subunit [Bosea sp. BE168]MDR7173150.1 ABC-type sugar transport system ATPase subunit [Bosea sp. BE271]
MAGLKLSGVRKAYGATTVLHGIDLDVADGEFVVFVGPSGCGKSTLLRSIAGLEEITGGTIAIDGADATHLPASERGLAMVFQSYALYPHMTVRANMAFALENMGFKRDEIDRRVKRAAEMLRLTDYLERKPKALSGGQRQRVAIGRAIVRDPKIFLFDEPLSNLDAELRVATRKELAALHAEIGGTMIYVTHDQVEAMTLADRIVVLQGGRIEQVGTPLELYNRPDNLFVAGFIGSPRMNLLPGRVTASGKVELGEGGHEVACATGHLAVGSKVTLGIRPEHLALAPEGQGLSLAIDLVERLGGESYLYGTAAGLPQITLRLDGQSEHERGHSVALAFPQQSLHLFDETGRAIRP